MEVVIDGKPYRLATVAPQPTPDEVADLVAQKVVERLQVAELARVLGELVDRLKARDLL